MNRSERMKAYKANIGEPMTNIKGEIARDPEKNLPIITRDHLVNMLGSYKAKSREELKEILALLNKMRMNSCVEPELYLSRDEYVLLGKILEAFIPIYPAYIAGQILTFYEAITEEEVEIKRKGEE